MLASFSPVTPTDWVLLVVIVVFGLYYGVKSAWYTFLLGLVYFCMDATKEDRRRVIKIIATGRWQ